MTAYVYRCYDAEDRLIYVGVSTNVEQRMSTHRYSWWHDQVARVSKEECESRWDAERREAEVIRTERPRWNIQGNPRDTIDGMRDLITSLENSDNAHLPYTQWWLEKLRTDLASRERAERGACPHCGQDMPVATEEVAA